MGGLRQFVNSGDEVFELGFKIPADGYHPLRIDEGISLGEVNEKTGTRSIRIGFVVDHGDDEGAKFSEFINTGGDFVESSINRFAKLLHVTGTDIAVCNACDQNGIDVENPFNQSKLEKLVEIMNITLTGKVFESIVKTTKTTKKVDGVDKEYNNTKIVALARWGSGHLKKKATINKTSAASAVNVAKRIDVDDIS